MTKNAHHHHTIPDDLIETIRNKALALGFCDVGFIDIHQAQHHPHWQQACTHLNEWLANNYHSHMDWMTTHQALRQQLDGLLLGAKTIVVVALNYYQGDAANPPEQPIKIAQYAWGKDYHRLIRKRLQKLLEAIQQQVPHCQGRPITDSAPLLEKPLAQLAGLGWQGKNTLLISKTKGSFLFLGELLLDIALPELQATPLQPYTNHCGTCTRCMVACPTDALPEPHVLDSNRCISTWTIERPDNTPIPEPIASQLEGWAFGCDVCQQVCPWNIRFAQPSDDPAFTPREWLATPNSDDILTMNEATFINKAANSPLKRTGLNTLKGTINTILNNQ